MFFLISVDFYILYHILPLKSREKATFKYIFIDLYIECNLNLIHAERKDTMDTPNPEYNLTLPCRPGTKVYAFCPTFGVLEYTVNRFIIDEKYSYCECSAYSKPVGDNPSECLDEIEPNIDDFGVSVFLKQEDVPIP